MKVVINGKYGGVGLLTRAIKIYCQYNGTGLRNQIYYNIRNDPILIRVVEELGEMAGGVCSKLVIVEIPDDVEWTIEEYDGSRRNTGVGILLANKCIQYIEQIYFQLSVLYYTSRC